MPTLVWFRNDLRTRDNPALWHAAQYGDDVLGLFILTPEQWRSHDMAGCRADFLLSALKLLRTDLQALGIPLQVIHGDSFANVPGQVVEFCRQHQIKQAFWNDEYPWDEVVRDAAVAQALNGQGIDVRRFHDRLLLPPEAVLTQQGEPYKVFTPFKKNLLAQLDIGLPDLLPAPAPAPRPLPAIALNPIPDSLPGFSSHIDTALWSAGERCASDKLEAFAAEHLARYQQDRDFPSIDGTSTLSPYLAIGNLSPQQCLLAALSGPPGEGANTWISEIIWRDFYQYIAWHFPRVCKHRAFNLATEAVPWRYDEAQFTAWSEGRTGVPIVDAGMRQLRQTGWMHNRVRMIVAMFLSKNLLLDWRLGERFFMQHLIDGDFPANNGGWQWSASTGTDAAPYFRIFNPFTQAEKFDPDARYIKQYVTELAALAPADIHHPARLQKAKPIRYPAVMVDLTASRNRAIDAFKSHL